MLFLELPPDVKSSWLLGNKKNCRWAGFTTPSIPIKTHYQTVLAASLAALQRSKLMDAQESHAGKDPDVENSLSILGKLEEEERERVGLSLVYEPV